MIGRRAIADIQRRHFTPVIRLRACRSQSICFKRGLSREIGFESDSDRGAAGWEISWNLRAICSGTDRVMPPPGFQELPANNGTGVKYNFQIE